MRILSSLVLLALTADAASVRGGRGRSSARRSKIVGGGGKGEQQQALSAIMQSERGSFEFCGTASWKVLALVGGSPGTPVMQRRVRVGERDCVVSGAAGLVRNLATRPQVPVHGFIQEPAGPAGPCTFVVSQMANCCVLSSTAGAILAQTSPAPSSKYERFASGAAAIAAAKAGGRYVQADAATASGAGVVVQLGSKVHAFADQAKAAAFCEKALIAEVDNVPVSASAAAGDDEAAGGSGDAANDSGSGDAKGSQQPPAAAGDSSSDDGGADAAAAASADAEAEASLLEAGSRSRSRSRSQMGVGTPQTDWTMGTRQLLLIVADFSDAPRRGGAGSSSSSSSSSSSTAPAGPSAADLAALSKYAQRAQAYFTENSYGGLTVNVTVAPKIYRFRQPSTDPTYVSNAGNLIDEPLADPHFSWLTGYVKPPPPAAAPAAPAAPAAAAGNGTTANKSAKKSNATAAVNATALAEAAEAADAEAKAAAAAATVSGLPLSKFDMHAVVWPQQLRQFDFEGVGFVGARGLALNGLSLDAQLPDEKLGRWAYHVLSHELGHNFGLSHALVGDDDTGSATGRLDGLTIMGGGSAAENHVNAAGKAGLGWIPAEDVKVVPFVAGPGGKPAKHAVRLYPFDLPGAAKQGLRLVKVETADRQRYVTVSLRAALTAGLAANGIGPEGAQLHVVAKHSTQTALIDGTPSEWAAPCADPAKTLRRWVQEHCPRSCRGTWGAGMPGYLPAGVTYLRRGIAVRVQEVGVSKSPDGGASLPWLDLEVTVDPKGSAADASGPATPLQWMPAPPKATTTTTTTTTTAAPTAAAAATNGTATNGTAANGTAATPPPAAATAPPATTTTTTTSTTAAPNVPAPTTVIRACEGVDSLEAESGTFADSAPGRPMQVRRRS